MSKKTQTISMARSEAIVCAATASFSDGDVYGSDIIEWTRNNIDDEISDKTMYVYIRRCADKGFISREREGLNTKIKYNILMKGMAMLSVWKRDYKFNLVNIEKRG